MSQMNDKPAIIVGFDFGMKYIGVACGQTITNTASPITCLRAKDGIPKWQEIDNIINSWQPQQIIVGIPLNMDGSMQHITLCAKKFANRLAARFNHKYSIQLVDERLSTWEAKQRNICKTNIAQLNAQAATILVEQWLHDEN